jgi:RNA polymerase sigma-70 factor (ECF subfamily)
MEAQAYGSDEDLLAAFREDGMPRHLDLLFQRHLAKVRAMLYQMVLNDADADDLTQDVFIRVARYAHKFNSRAAFSTWLHRITMNCAKSFIARKMRNPVDVSPELPEPTAGLETRPDHALSTSELDERISEAIDGLRPKLRAAVVLTIMQGISIPEAARIEGCALPTMYWRVHEARRQLKVCLKEDL